MSLNALTATRDMLVRAIQMSERTLTTKLRGVEHYRTPSGMKVYSIHDVLPRLDRPRWRRPHILQAIISDASVEDVSPVVCDQPDSRIDELLNWFDKDQLARLHRQQSDFALALANSAHSSFLFQHLPRLQSLLILDGDVLEYVVVGNEEARPCWEGRAMEFAVANFGDSEVHCPQPAKIRTLNLRYSEY